MNILPVEPGEKVSAMLHVREFGDMYIFMVTRSGTVKRLPLDAIKNIRKTGIRALSIAEDDELITVRLTDGKQNILIATHEGYAICFDENDVRPMGREAAGVRGIKLREGDYVVGAGRAGGGTALLSVTENGYGKRTELDEYLRGADGERQPQSRGGMGLKNYNCTEKTGYVADVKVVREDDDLLIVADDGTIIRTAASGVSVLGRATQGVRIMRPNPGAKVISVARTEREDAE